MLTTLRKLALCAVLPGSLAAPTDQAFAAPITLDFEELPAMTFWSGSPIPEYAKLSSQYSALGVTFSSGADYVAVVELGYGHATSGKNGIGGARPEGILTYDSGFPITATFSGTTDYVSLRGDMSGSSWNVTLSAFDIGGALIATTTVPDSGGAYLTLSVEGIHSVQFFGTYDMGGVAIDDFSFNAVTPLQPVPEPETYAMILLGLGLMGGVLKRSGATRRYLSSLEPQAKEAGK